MVDIAKKLIFCAMLWPVDIVLEWLTLLYSHCMCV